ncbi:hypothetical protein C474_10074 [Halogeometricum pallidum JCM 14848]|uniref:Uncharacterized protein n=1 Tax=Halogeometricum pallidum JCM 14848 TaxID=1227487 RepID=M0D8Z4_HALPD|nr:hypothetical protein [Halogeometricum pallidum]ELZ31172.1 hypothetical protein C474_10074 [Halogeometricum pallidum JCM 14848]
MSVKLTPGAVRAFYGTPQHETRPLTDPEAACVVTAPSPPTDRELRSYAEWSSAERRRIQAEALRRRVERERTEETSPASNPGARGVMVRW